MKLEEAIQRLDRTAGLPGTKTSVKIKQRFSNILQEVKYKELSAGQHAVLERELERIFGGVDLEEDNIDKYLRKQLKELIRFLRIHFSLLPEGYCALYGMRLGLAVGAFLLLILYFYSGSTLQYYLPLGGMLLEVMTGSICDRRLKAKGKALLTRMV